MFVREEDVEEYLLSLPDSSKPNEVSEVEDFVLVTAFHCVNCALSSLQVELMYAVRLKSSFLIRPVATSRLEICSGHKNSKKKLDVTGV